MDRDKSVSHACTNDGGKISGSVVVAPLRMAAIAAGVSGMRTKFHTVWQACAWAWMVQQSSAPFLCRCLALANDENPQRNKNLGGSNSPEMDLWLIRTSQKDGIRLNLAYFVVSSCRHGRIIKLRLFLWVKISSIAMQLFWLHYRPLPNELSRAQIAGLLQDFLNRRNLEDVWSQTSYRNKRNQKPCFWKLVAIPENSECAGQVHH